VGRVLPYGEAITYWPLAEIVRQVGGEDPLPAIAELVAGDESAELRNRQKVVGANPIT
jgi:hypothetical protein